MLVPFLPNIFKYMSRTCKVDPAKSRLARTVSVTINASQNYIDNSIRTPASLNTSIIICAEKLGYHLVSK
jgi:hypothetical protein